jgi:hypothetical protein
VVEGIGKTATLVLNFLVLRLGHEQSLVSGQTGSVNVRHRV